jgi:hypothetical protein
VKIIGADWLDFLYPAIHTILAGLNPYTNQEIAQPPWTFLILAPLAFLPPMLSVIGINFISVSGVVTFFYRNKKKWLAFPLVASYPFLVLLAMGNLDGLLMWGLTIGGPIGLILLMIKPQAGILVGFIWAIKAWKKDGLKAVAILVGPVAVLTIISVILYPQWPGNLLWFSSRNFGQVTNGFPWLVPLGIGLFIAAVRKEREDWAAVATLLITPYVRTQSWTIALCLLALYNPLEGVIVSLSTWLVYLKVVIAK